MEQKIKFPRSQKVYLPGKLYPNIRVAMRKVEQVPSVSFEGEEKIATPNPEIYVYDTSGPFSDAEMNIDLKKGLPRTGAVLFVVFCQIIAECYSSTGVPVLSAVSSA